MDYTYSVFLITFTLMVAISSIYHTVVLHKVSGRKFLIGSVEVGTKERFHVDIYQSFKDLSSLIHVFTIMSILLVIAIGVVIKRLYVEWKENVEKEKEERENTPIYEKLI